MTTMIASRRHQFGFSIVEALVALLVMGFGILALAGMQATLSRSADDARQRTEAVRLAQEKVEELRSYTGIASTRLSPTTFSTTLNWDNIVGGSDSITTNAAYTRSWAVAGVVADPSRAANVTVSWTDRANQAQTVSLATVLSKTDPADVGFLAFPLPQNTNLKRPKNRNLDIPIPAIDLNNGQSAVKFGTGSRYVLFDNISADVVKFCTSTLSGSPTNAQIITDLTTTATCTNIKGYIVAGYVSRDSSVSDSDWNAIQGGLGINPGGLSRNAAGAQAIECQFGDAVDQNSGVTIPNFKSYLCVIPLDLPNPALTVNGPYNWSGKLLIGGPAVWNASGNKYFVCRYQYAATNSLTDVNARNVQPYVEVNRSIDQQNYLIGTTSNSTSTASPTCPSSMNVDTLTSPVTSVSTGVLHQDCRSASNAANYSTTCTLLGATTSYTVTYNSNGATGGTAPTDPTASYSGGATVTVLGNSGNMSKFGGFSFAGWNTAAGGTGTPYAAGAPFTIGANTTLYAQWSALPTYSITYNGNGSTGGTVPLDGNSPYTQGAVATVLNAGSMVRTNYTFNGWNTLAAGTGTAYAGGSVLPGISGPVTLYAQWVVTPTYTVTYNGNGSTSGTVPLDALSPYVSGLTVTVKSNLGTLAIPGYSFNGWNTVAGGTGISYLPNAQFAISSNTTLFAQWAPIVLTTPVPSWAVGTDPRTLTWPAINGATAYLVSSCNLVNSNSTTCTPVSPVSQAATTKDTSAMGTRDTWCYSVIATGPAPYVSSAASATKCISRAANGNYSYQ